MNIIKHTVSKRRFYAEYPLFEAEDGEDAKLANAFSEHLMSLLTEEARRHSEISFSLKCDAAKDGAFDDVLFTLRCKEHGRRVLQRRLRVRFLSGLIKEFQIIP
ncbi:MAG: hypothetical protein IJQ80_03170 [Clostridia bacterium]|nr:hypothetical protein [Clostridia bacterium]